MVILEDRIRDVLRLHYGAFETKLELIYENQIVQVLMDGDINNNSKWVTYNQVILEYKKVIKDFLKVKELQYRLIEKEDPDNVCMDVIRNTQMKTPELQRLYEKIMNFKE